MSNNLISPNFLGENYAQSKKIKPISMDFVGDYGGNNYWRLRIVLLFSWSS